MQDIVTSHVTQAYYTDHKDNPSIKQSASFSRIPKKDCEHEPGPEIGLVQLYTTAEIIRSFKWFCASRKSMVLIYFATAASEMISAGLFIR